MIVQSVNMNLRKKRNGCPGATAATDLVCYLFCWKTKKAQNCLKAWSAISVLNSPCHNQQVWDLSQVNSWTLKILNSTEKRKKHDTMMIEQPANLTCGDIDILKRWLEVLRPFSLEWISAIAYHSFVYFEKIKKKEREEHL